VHLDVHLDGKALMNFVTDGLPYLRRGRFSEDWSGEIFIRGTLPAKRGKAKPIT